MFYRRRAGLPRPDVNQPVFDLDGRFLGIPDLLDLEAGLACRRWSWLSNSPLHNRGAGLVRRQHRDDNLWRWRRRTS
jgi:hypothetical protein